MRVSWVVLTGLIAIGCHGPDAPVSSSAQAIVAGTVDTGDPAIMEVLSFKGNLGSRCTATLVTPRILLLAAHCFVETPGFPQRFVFPGNDDRNVPDKDLLPIKTFVYDPQYTTPRQGHDFAVVVLETPMAIPPIRINRAPLNQAQGKTIRYVGYGLTVVGNRGSGGVKRQNSAPLAEVSPLLLGVAPNAHAACEGDSGGPMLFDDGKGEAIVGVGSFVTNPECLRSSYYQRIDTQLAWLDQQIQKYDPGGLAPPADGGPRDGPPASPPDAEAPATTPDARPVDTAPSMMPAPDARPRTVDSAAPAMEPEPEPTPGTKPAGADGGGCSAGRRPSGGGSALLLIALAALGRRRRR
jgi:hypothetical protein